MRRGQLGRKIAVYTHRKFGVSVQMYLDSDGLFGCEFNGKIIRFKTLEELKAWIAKSIESVSDLQWVGVIEVDFNGWENDQCSDDQRSLEVRFYFSRYWLARRPDDVWLKAKWGTLVGSRVEGAQIWAAPKGFSDFPFTEKPETWNRRRTDPTYYVEHTKELWATLNALTVRLQKLRKDLIDILGTVDGRAKLSAGILNGILKLLPRGST